jgi:dolichyl-phosphate-mannose-protein mannosyltransferase
MNLELRDNGPPRYDLFAGAIFVAAAVRFYLLGQYYCISSDSLGYIEAARDFYSGDIVAGLDSFYPPGYPVFIAAVYPLVGNWELSGQIISITCGVLLFFPLSALCTDLYGHRVALMASFLAAVSPYLARYAVHVRTESPFLFLSTWALLLFYRGMAQGMNRDFFYGGLVAGFAYLVRPESIGFLVVVPAILGLTWWIKRDHSLIWVSIACALLFVGFFLFALPYIYYLSSVSGQWGSVSKKAGITLVVSLTQSGLLEDVETQTLVDLQSLSFLQFISGHPLLYIKKVLLDVLPSIATYFEAVYYSYVPFLLVGLFLVLREKFWLRKDLLLVGFVAFYLIGFALIFVNLRYSVQLVPISLGWTSVGLLWCYSTLKQACSFETFRTIAVTVAVVFLAGTLPKTLMPIAREKAHVREAGRYIETIKGSEGVSVFVFDERITFYGNVKPILLNELNESKLLEKIRRREGLYLATELKPWQKRFPRIALEPDRYGLIVDKEFPVPKKDRLVIFKIT